MSTYVTGKMSHYAINVTSYNYIMNIRQTKKTPSVLWKAL